jgi:protein-L-isoaspartate(D-aspartate) O-methyltransferase
VARQPERQLPRAGGGQDAPGAVPTAGAVRTAGGCRPPGEARAEEAQAMTERESDPRATRDRERMVDEQLVRRGITDERVLAAMRQVPRQLFVQEALRDRAYGDHPLPIGEEQTISQPYIVALMSSLLELTGREKVLEVGTGSGYQAAVLGVLARRVCSIERLPRLAERARATLESLGVDNVWIRVGNGTLGWPDEAPFDRIVVTAGGPAVPPPLFQQLAEGGRMVVPIGDMASQTLTVVDNAGGQMRLRPHGDCKFVRLVGKYAWEP